MKKIVSAILICIFVLSLSYFVSAGVIKTEKINDYSKKDSHGVDMIMKAKISDAQSLRFVAQSATNSQMEYQPVRMFHTFLQDSVSLINASTSWNLQTNSLNLTGAGQTVCIIDTGINYSHADFGGCNPVSRVHNTFGEILNYSLNNTNHPYGDSISENYSITMPGFTQIAVHFVKIETEYSWDFVKIINSSNSIVASYSGYKYDFWSVSVPGDTIQINLTSDDSYHFNGFYIDKVINGTANTTEIVNWTNCSKILGGWDVLNEDADPLDDYGHGTHVAGIVAANGGIKGVAPDAKLIIIKAGDSNGDFTDLNIQEALDWCINNASKFNISVISMSLGGGFYNDSCDISYDGIVNNTPDLSDNYDYYNFTARFLNASSKNISVVIATGNDGNYTHIAFPSCMKNVTPVGSTTKGDVISTFSNRNFLVKLVATGGNGPASGGCTETINSTSSAGGYLGQCGTSMATPHVAGAIAIINQYLRATGRTNTSAQIERVLNSTGKQINDSYSNLTYSRINLYSALLSMDNQAPNSSLIYPTNNMLDENANQTLRCNVSDWQLANITFYLWNSSSGLVNLTTMEVSGTFASVELNVTNLSNQRYNWNCYSCDVLGHCKFSDNGNYSFKIGTIQASLNSPAHNNYSRLATRNVTFNCSGETSTDLSLANITFYLWNSTSGAVENSTQIINVSGNLNNTLFNYNFLTQGRYYWNCFVINNNSDSAFANGNYTLTYDTQAPTGLDSMSPAHSADYYDDDSITLKYTPVDNFELQNCTLRVKSSSITSSNPTSGVEKSYGAGTFEAGSNYWNVTCFDKAGNSAFSGNYRLDITVAEDDSSDNSGGGGSDDGDYSSDDEDTTTTNDDATVTSSHEGSSESYVVLSYEDVKNGSDRIMKKGDILKIILPLGEEFNATTNTSRPINESHTLEINEITNNSVNLTVRSEPIDITLRISEERRIYFSSNYTLYIKLNSIENETANLNIEVDTKKESWTSSFSGNVSNLFRGIGNWIVKNYVLILIVIGVIALIIGSNIFVYRLAQKNKLNKPINARRSR
jgi:subtilisin family serine protease